jgi:cytoskeletal protein RodZ
MNDMTDFDKLIKEKAEQASYPYEEAAWRQYKRKAGLQGGSAKYWFVGAASFVAVGAFFLLKPARQNQPMPDQSQQVVATVDDSAMTSKEFTITESEDTVTIPVDQKAKQPLLRASQNEKENTIGNQSTIVKDTPTVTRKAVLGRPLVIDVDTITRMVPTDEELEKGHSRLF